MSTTKTSRIKPLTDAAEKKVEAVAADLFETDELRKAAVVYGRKLTKYVEGKRSSRPPIPAALQDGDKKITRERCVSIASALGLDLVKAGLDQAPPLADQAPAAVEDVTAAPKTPEKTPAKSSAKPDPKPESSKRSAKRETAGAAA